MTLVLAHETLIPGLTAACTALIQHGDATAHAPGDAALWQPLRQRLVAMAQWDNPSYSAAVREAFQMAIARLQRDRHNPAAAAGLLRVLQMPGDRVDRFRQAAIEELLLGTHPNLGRLADLYRRTTRNAAAPPQTALPAWQQIVPALQRFFGTLLPQALAAQPQLRQLLLTADERQQLDRLRQRPLIAAVEQRIVASEGGSIAQVQQWLVQGDYYAAPPALVSPDLEQLYHRYQSFVTETFGLLDFRGMLQAENLVRLHLESVYVPLSCHSVGHVASSLTIERVPVAEEGLQTATPGVRMLLHDVVRDTPLLVVLGEPGAGKSTLVRYLLLALAAGQAETRLGLHGTWLPILFPVAAFAEARAATARANLAPLDYLAEYFAGLSQPDYRPLFLQALQRGQALVLLDGFDEARDERLELTRCLEAFVREWDGPGNRFLATSRVAGYDDAPLDDQLFARVVIDQLSDDDIRRFVDRWCEAYERATAQEAVSVDPLVEHELLRRAHQRSLALNSAVFTTTTILDLARNPLLLTILALIHHQGARLPHRRADLYRLCVEALAETWNRVRSLSGLEIDLHLGSEKIDARFVVNLLGPLALWKHREQLGMPLERSDLLRQIARTLMQTDGMPPGRAQRVAQNFVELVRRDTGLLQERGHGRYSFVHLTFEEYLAARALLESVIIDDPDSMFHAYATDPAWREVLRLAVASASQREAQRLVLHILEAPATGLTYGRPVVLAGECLLDIGRTGATQHMAAAVTTALTALLGNGAALPTIRVEAGHLLGQLGDPRLLDEQRGDAPAGGYWRGVAAGSFFYSDEPGSRALRPITLPYEYAIGRTLITNAEFRRFVDAGGYHEQRWWSVEGWAFLQPGGHPSSFGDNVQPIVQPGLWENPQFNGANQPVVGVSWYEAQAYCCWLTDQGHQHNWLMATAQLRLPTSLEWERVARHTDSRRYPWGDEQADSQRANYDQTGIRAPSPIGCFPAGSAANGALDLAGNVWEWTASLWEHHAAQAPCMACTSRAMPVIRGGAFNWGADYLQCSTRYWFSAGTWHNLLGFRLVWRNDDA